MERRCCDCVHSGKSYTYSRCNSCCFDKGFPNWSPSKTYLKNTRKKVLNIMYDLTRKYDLKLTTPFWENDTQVTVDVVKYDVSTAVLTVVSTFVFDLTKCELDDETIGYIEDDIKTNLAELNGGNYLKNMDVLSWYPDRSLFDPTLKKALNYAYGSEFMGIDEIRKYCEQDVETTKKLFDMHIRGKFMMMTKPEIKRVIFSDPCTIVLWVDGTKTIVRTQGDDVFDPEKGLAMAIAKKTLGNDSGYYDEFKKWLPKEEEKPLKVIVDFDGGALVQACMDAGVAIRSGFDDAMDNINKCNEKMNSNEEWKRAIAKFLSINMHENEE